MAIIIGGPWSLQSAGPEYRTNMFKRECWERFEVWKRQKKYVYDSVNAGAGKLNTEDLIPLFDKDKHPMCVM